jgi:hypothetical protein
MPHQRRRVLGRRHGGSRLGPLPANGSRRLQLRRVSDEYAPQVLRLDPDPDQCMGVSISCLPAKSIVGKLGTLV